MTGARLTDTAIDAPALLAAFQAACPDAGAIVSFTGQMRPHGADGAALAALHLQSYRGMTLASVAAMVEEARRRFAVLDVAAVHRIGRILPAEPIVFVAAAALHRRAAFDAADWLMDQLKSRAILWKREERADGTCRWIEPTAEDAAALSRWMPA